MVPDVELTSPAEAEWVASQRKWTRGWRQLVLPGVFLVYLLYVVGPIGRFSRGAGAVFGYVVLAGFAVSYLAMVGRGCRLPRGDSGPCSAFSSRCFWPSCLSRARQPS
jgi:hypothetical protein